MSKEKMSPPPMKHGKKGHGGPPGKPVEKAKDFKGTVKKLLKLIAPFKFKFILIVFLAACSSLFAVIGPKFSHRQQTRFSSALSVCSQAQVQLTLKK